MSEAKKALERTTIFGFGKQQKYEDAAENYTNAGNAYKLASDFPNAAKAFIKCSQVWEQTSEKFNITNALVEAGQCYKRAQNPTNAIKALCKAIELYNDDGRIGMSAKYTQEIAEILENDHNITSAIEVYEEAAHLYDLDKMKSNSNACLTKVAQFLSTTTDGNGDLKKAGGIYEKLGDESMSSRLGQYSARGYFLQALLCYLAMGDAVQVNKKITEFKNADYSFASSNECTFIQKLVKVSMYVYYAVPSECNNRFHFQYIGI